jgi:ACS family D-galactonate transporter-like MFS transporter
MGLIFSAFSWSYFAAQIPGGLALDRFGARLVYLVALAGWSLSTLLHATATGFASLFGWRISLGLFEAPCFPANSNIVGAWFPRAERARAIGVYTAAEYVALGFASPLLLWVLHSHGWRALFLVSGMLGLVLVPLWSKLYREPAEHPGINTAELALIRDGGGRVAGETAAFTSARLWQLAHHPQIIALCIGQFAVYSTFVFFLTWFPTYLATARHMAWIRLGFFASLPYLAGFFGILFAGWLSDFLLQRGASLNNARKIPVIAGLLLASSIVLANYVESDAVVVAILSLAFFAQAMSSSGWSVLSEIAPPGTLGMVGSLFSAAANLSGIVTPLVIAAIYQQTGSFNLALAFVGAVAAAGAAAWIFFVGDLKPIAG